MNDALKKHYDTHHTLIDWEVLISNTYFNSGINIILRYGLGDVEV